MVSCITNNVEVSVRTSYQEAASNPDDDVFVHFYQICITNYSDYAIQLKSRFWRIIESNGKLREVKGMGVVGEQPILEPGETHEYVSACKIDTELGKMFGKYNFIRVADRHRIVVGIPAFVLCYPVLLN